MMRMLWHALYAVMELILFLAMLFVALTLVGAYMVAFGGVPPGGPMPMHEAPHSIDETLVLLAVAILIGGAAFAARRAVLRKLAR